MGSNNTATATATTTYGNKSTTGYGYKTYTPERKETIRYYENYHRNMNTSELEEIETFMYLCKLDDPELKSVLTHFLTKFYPDVISEDGYIYAKGNDPVLLTAHMDTVHKYLIKDWYEDVYTKEGRTYHELSSPEGIGGDDRCGIYMICRILATTTYRPSILFCEDEEIGGVGSGKFCLTKYINDLSELKFLIELDRANKRDLVFYYDDNVDFHHMCEDVTGYREEYGSFSDISKLAPACGLSAVNISCGYYRAHTTNEYVIWEEMLDSIDATIKLIAWACCAEIEPYKYVEYVPYYKRNNTYKYGNYSNSYYNTRYYDDDYDDWYTGYSNRNYGQVSTQTEPEVLPNIGEVDETTYILQVAFLVDGKEYEASVKGATEGDCWMNFFLENSDVCFNDVIDFDMFEA